MTWTILILGLLLAAFGASASAAVLLASRAELAVAVSRRLRGGAESLAWVNAVDRDLAGASITISLAMLLMGAAVPALVTGASLLELGLLLVLVVVPLILFSGFVLPRWLTQYRAERVAALLGPVLRVWARIVSPLLPAEHRERPADLRALWHEGAQAGLAADQDLVMAGGVMSFARKPVREAMTPRTEIIAVPESATLQDIRRVFLDSGYTRLPVYRETLDEIIGMIHAFDLFKLQPGEPLPIRPVAQVPEGRSCADLLVDMQRERRHLAVVLDEFGGTLGLVTLEDLLEGMVGEIFDEDEPGAPGQGTAAPDLLEADATLSVAEVEEHYHTTLPAGHATSLAGRLAELAGRIPVEGERFLIAGLEIDVLAASPLRAERLLVRPAGSPTTVLGGAE
jgi:CBS domain containing-hemolysin-like protein